MSGRIRVQRSGPVASLSLDNPGKRNAFDTAMLGDLTQAAADLAGDTEVHLVLLRGAGALAFSSGADVSSFAGPDGTAGFAELYRGMEQALDDAVAALSTLPQPLVAGLSGACMGGGLQLALCADIRLASDSLKLAVPAVGFGLVYPIDAIERVIALCGPATAKLIFMGGRAFSADAALRAGIVDIVVPTASFEEELASLCGQIAGYPKPAVRAYKILIDKLARGADPAELRELQNSVNLSDDTAARMEAAALHRSRRPP